MSLLSMAWRNLWRNRVRTAVTGSAIALSLCFQLVMFGISDETYNQMLEGAAKGAGGAVLVHAEGYWEERAPERLLTDARAALAAVEGTEGVRAAMPRLIVPGLLSSSRGNQGVELRGVDVGREAAILDLSRYLVEGALLEGDERRPVLLGGRLAKDLGVGLGDRVVLTATDPNGEPTRALFRVGGLLGGAAMERAAFTRLEVAQEALRAGDVVTQIGVMGEVGIEAATLEGAVAETLSGREDLELLTWSEATPEMVKLIEADKAQGYMMTVIILLIVGFGIANTFLMAVMERVRELGLLAALGMTPVRIRRLLLVESLALAAVAGGIGVALAYGVHLWLAGTGIDMAAMGGGEFEMGGVMIEDYRIRSTLVPARWIGGTAAVVALVVVSTLYPALRASRLDPVAAMRTYE